VNASEPRRPTARHLLGFLIGAALLAAAAIAIARNADQFSSALRAAEGARWWLVALALVLPAINWLIMSLSFWLLMRRHGQLSFSEMACLIGAAWLLNYLPLRPGLVGRVAYHKAVNRIPVAKSIAVTVISLACAGVAIGIMLGACLVCAATSPSVLTQLILVCAIPTLSALTATLICRSLHAPWWLPATILFRYIDLLTWSARYLVVFAIIGHPLTLPAAAAIAAVGQVAMLVPFVGNGIGLREWSVGLVASVLPPGVLSGRGTLTTAVGLFADLVNRIAELLCAVPIGLLCAASLSRRKHLSEQRLR
jgi:hypothetical protein